MQALSARVQLVKPGRVRREGQPWVLAGLAARCAWVQRAHNWPRQQAGGLAAACASAGAGLRVRYDRPLGALVPAAGAQPCGPCAPRRYRRRPRPARPQPHAAPAALRRSPYRPCNLLSTVECSLRLAGACPQCMSHCRAVVQRAGLRRGRRGESCTARSIGRPTACPDRGAACSSHHTQHRKAQLQRQAGLRCLRKGLVSQAAAARRRRRRRRRWRRCRCRCPVRPATHLVPAPAAVASPHMPVPASCCIQALLALQMAPLQPGGGGWRHAAGRRGGRRLPGGAWGGPRAIGARAACLCLPPGRQGRGVRQQEAVSIAGAAGARGSGWGCFSTEQ